MATTVSDEQIIAALMSNGTIKAAAGAVGISTKTLSDRMTTREFKDCYRSAKADVIRKAIFDLNKQVGSAVACIVEIMNDPSVNPSLRLQSAQTILKYSSMFSQRLSNDEQTYLEQQRAKMTSFRL